MGLILTLFMHGMLYKIDVLLGVLWNLTKIILLVCFLWVSSVIMGKSDRLSRPSWARSGFQIRESSKGLIRISLLYCVKEGLIELQGREQQPSDFLLRDLKCRLVNTSYIVLLCDVVRLLTLFC